MSDPVFVDASAAPIRTDDGQAILIKTTIPGSWFYFARRARMSIHSDGELNLSLVRRRSRTTSDGGETEAAVTEGGILATQVELSALAPSASDESVWIDTLKDAGES